MDCTSNISSQPGQGSAESPILSSFKLFPNLPLELRRLIWATTLQPRVVEVRYDQEEGFFPAHAETPMALQVCQESRSATIHSYPLCFSSICYDPKIRFNFALDTLYIDGILDDNIPHFLSTFRDREIVSLQILAINSDLTSIVHVDDTLNRTLKRAVESLTGLKELLVVFDVEEMTDRALGCGGDHHQMNLYEEKPKELSLIEIDPLPTAQENEERGLDFHLWKVPLYRSVYGYRRCPKIPDDFVEDFHPFFDSDSEWFNPSRDLAEGAWIPFYHTPLNAIPSLFSSDDDEEHTETEISEQESEAPSLD